MELTVDLNVDHLIDTLEGVTAYEKAKIVSEFLSDVISDIEWLRDQIEDNLDQDEIATLTTWLLGGERALILSVFEDKTPEGLADLFKKHVPFDDLNRFTEALLRKD